MQSFWIQKNNFLGRPVKGFYHMDYVGYKKTNNPDFIVDLKNTNCDVPSQVLDQSESQVQRIISDDLPKLLDLYNMEKADVVIIPRAKKPDYYITDQKRFAHGVAKAVESQPRLINALGAIVRQTNTRTTHLKKYNHVTEGSLPMPYPGITRDTCYIDPYVKGKDIILVDDIYTKSINVDEDAIQALFDSGARSIVLYVIARTKFRKIGTDIAKIFNED